MLDGAPDTKPNESAPPHVATSAGATSSAVVEAASGSSERPTFDDVYAREFDYVWCTLRRMGVPESSLPDAAHDVFVVVFRRLGDFDPSRPVRPWLFGIAYRVASDRRALAYNRKESPTDVLPETAAATEPDALQSLERSQRRAMVHTALGSVDAAQRAVLIAHDLEERPMADVAREMEIPLKTAWSRLRLARESLTRALQRAMKRGGER
jgi:RNA polymerase sigma-70 factor (ECF subfamily)